MNFNSLKEYFFKLYNAAMKRILLPLVTFLGIYYLFLSGLILPFVEDETMISVLLVLYPVIILTSLTIVHLEVRKMLKSNVGLVGLGNKLDLFYAVVRRKMRTALWVSMFTATGFLLTSHQWFSLYFAGIILWFFFQWPSPRKAANQLKLKGDERKMVLTKGEAFRF
jgi:hypothetical protein